MVKLRKVKNFKNYGLKPIRLARVKHEDYTIAVSYQFSEIENGLLLDFIQTNTTDNNKWQKLNVVADKILYRYLFDSEIDKNNLVDFIETNYTQKKLRTEQTFDFQPIRDLAKDAKYLQVSLPYGIKFHENPSKRYKNTFRPVKVILDGQDYSYAFDDYDQFNYRIVDKVFDSIIKNKIPEINNDFFCSEQVSAIAEKLQ